mmetsp:Transcript_62660/g.103338  ORF Transcript_62660/g.103338 Transcript_62660/m.103338 type:complete len:89 (+) Transcript_62660:147-413(+)
MVRQFAVFFYPLFAPARLVAAGRAAVMGLLREAFSLLEENGRRLVLHIVAPMPCALRQYIAPNKGDTTAPHPHNHWSSHSEERREFWP